VQDIGERRQNTMKRMIDDNKPVGKLTRVKDFLPSPEELAVPERKVKVTIALSETSIEFFKRIAKQHHTKYQKMIRNLLDKYALQHI
jgi:predicted DNA binding CopG/RHH family protein